MVSYQTPVHTYVRKSHLLLMTDANYNDQGLKIDFWRLQIWVGPHPNRADLATAYHFHFIIAWVCRLQRRMKKVPSSNSEFSDVRGFLIWRSCLWRLVLLGSQITQEHSQIMIDWTQFSYNLLYIGLLKAPSNCSSNWRDQLQKNGQRKFRGDGSF